MKSRETGPARPQGFEVVKFFCRHLVCIAVRWIALDPAGRRNGKPQLYTASGFVVEWRGHWLLLTAGHVPQELDQFVKARQIEILQTMLIDYLGPEAEHKEPVIIGYEQLKKAYIDDRELGLDLCVIELGTYLTEHLKASKVVPFDESKWMYLVEGEEFTHYRLVGLAAERVFEDAQPAPGSDFPGARIQPAMIGIIRLSPDQIADPPRSTLPWFIGHVPDGQGIDSIKGMSGGPIFGFKRIGNEARYSIVAMQSWWRPGERILFGCPVPVFMVLLTSHMERLAACGQPASSQRE